MPVDWMVDSPRPTRPSGPKVPMDRLPKKKKAKNVTTKRRLSYAPTTGTVEFNVVQKPWSDPTSDPIADIKKFLHAARTAYYNSQIPTDEEDMGLA